MNGKLATVQNLRQTPVTQLSLYFNFFCIHVDWWPALLPLIRHAKWGGCKIPWQVQGNLKTKSWKFKPSPEMSKVLTELNNKRFVHLESYTVSTCVSIKACENILKIPLREERVVLHNKVCSANKAMMKGCKGKSLQA